MKTIDREDFDHLQRDYVALETELFTIKRNLRQLLFEHGVPSNLLWTGDDIIKALYILLTGVEANIEGGRLPV